MLAVVVHRLTEGVMILENGFSLFLVVDAMLNEPRPTTLENNDATLDWGTIKQNDDDWHGNNETKNDNEERKAWRKDHPFAFVARPKTGADGSVNLMEWQCYIPGKEGTDWEGGYYPLEMRFSEDYPAKPPYVKFPAQFFHPNVYPSGKVCLSIINDDHTGTWKPAIAIKQILLGIQELLDNPNQGDPAQQYAYDMLRKDPSGYKRRVREERNKYREMPQ